MDFKRAFEDAQRKYKWEKERNAEEDKIRRQTMATTAGYAPQDMGRFLATGEGGQWSMPPINVQPIDGGYEQVGGKIYQSRKPSKFDLQKEARITVNAMISQNPTLQMKAFENPNLLTSLIDEEVARLSEQYGLPVSKKKLKKRVQEDEYEVNAIYENQEGLRKRYKGNGEWEDM